MSEVSFNYEITQQGAAKLAATRMIPQAHKKNLTAWIVNMVRDTKASGLLMQKSKSSAIKGRGGRSKSSQMGRNVGMVIKDQDGGFVGGLGTGIGGTQSVAYADIQDKGGLTRPEVTDKMRKFFWAMYFAEGGTASAKSGFKTKRIGRKRGESNDEFATRWLARNDRMSKWKGLALTKRNVLEVYIPRSHWFTGPIERARGLLDVMMTPEEVMKTAEQMAGTYVPNEWR